MRTMVLGSAVSGMAAARLARRLGHRVVVYDESREAAVRLLSEGLGSVIGEWDPVVLDGIRLVVTSPGFPEHAAPITDALERGIPVLSEIEFAWRELEGRPVVAVTGTNGKTTVTSLVSAMLEASGRTAPALGNIGSPLSDAVGDPLDVAVVEVSSFQLRFTEHFRPDVAVVTNVAPDHLDWHGSFAAYAEAKRRIVARQDAGDVLVFDADDEGASTIAASAPGRTVPVSGRRMPDGGAGVDGDTLVVGPVRLPLASMRTTDPAFLSDVAAAGAAALEAGADPDAVAAVAGAFVPGAHRRTEIGSVDGIRFVDDSKATNPHAALAAIDAYPSVVLIAGGLAKGLDLAPLARRPNVRHVVAIGRAAPDLLAAAGDRGTHAATMEAAVEAATAVARPGDVVLLAPGCASFDMFESYGERGDTFARAVSTIIAGESRTG